LTLQNGIKVNVALYGPIARAAGAKHIAQLDIALAQPATVGQAILCDAPGLNASHSYQLQEGDHIGIFSTVHMWPYQYRDGARMSDALREALKETGAMHHSYASRD